MQAHRRRHVHPVRRRLRRRRAAPNNAPKLIAAGFLSFVALFLLFNTTVAVVTVFGAVAAANTYFNNLNLPDPEKINNRDLARTTKIYDRNGVLINETYDPDLGKRTTVRADQISDHLKNAVIATEDYDFYENR